MREPPAGGASNKPTSDSRTASAPSTRSSADFASADEARSARGGRRHWNPELALIFVKPSGARPSRTKNLRAQDAGQDADQDAGQGLAHNVNLIIIPSIFAIIISISAATRAAWSEHERRVPPACDHGPPSSLVIIVVIVIIVIVILVISIDVISSSPPPASSPSSSSSSHHRQHHHRHRGGDGFGEEGAAMA